MGKGLPMRFGERVFSSKKAAREAIQQILYAYQIGQSLTVSDCEFMIEVFRGHSEWEMKQGVGIASIQVEQNMGSRGFWISRIDNSRTDISFVHSLTPPSIEHDARAALRTEVRQFIREFKDRWLTAGATCAVTGVQLREGEVHVDHGPPEFDTLVRTFMGDRLLSFEHIRVNPTEDGSTDTVLADRALAVDWYNFHASRANLRLVTRQANLSVLRKRR